MVKAPACLTALLVVVALLLVVQLPGTISSLHQEQEEEEQVVDAVQSISSSTSEILQDSIVEQINSNPRAGWKAAMNPRLSNYTISQFKRLLGVKPTPHSLLKSIPVITHPKSLMLPKEFDARNFWSHCSSIQAILDQGHCGSCWAFGAVESLSDRFCINFGMNITLSVNDLLACCGFMCGDGCDGGYPISAWRYLAKHGVVTDDDFAHYKSGVYKHITGDAMGGHAVKLIGWGTTDSGEDYWLLANQWNRSWGDGGYFKIRRGTNECGIEEDVVAGMPSTKNLIRSYTGVDAGNDVSI